jgi:protease-4
MRTIVFAGLLIATGTAAAQGVDRRYAEEPTEGMALPLVPLAGEHDARTVVANPGGLALLRGAEMALALGLEDPDVADSAGQGFGAFFGSTFGGGGLVPKFAMGLGFEWLRPPRSQLVTDPGSPFRFTLGFGMGLGKSTGVGFSWHHFSDEGLLDGADTFDLGLSTRWNNYLAVGATVRDLATSSIGVVPVQRRYELEAMVRPFGTASLELAVGGRIGETRTDVDGWARLSAKVTRGFTAHLGVETRDVHALVSTAAGLIEDDGRDVRAMVGLELSFGALGVTAIASGLRDDTGGRHALGGQVVVRSSFLGPPSVIGPADHIERVELSGTIGLREVTAHVVRMRAIVRDPTAKALVVTFDGVNGGWATLEELRDEIIAVKKSGRKVFAYMVSGTGRDYFIASAADKIYVDPAGGVRLVGMAGTTMYFKGFFDLVGVVPQFEKIAEFKSAPEQFTNIGPTATAAKMHNELYDSLWDKWLTQVAEGRKLSKAEVQALVDAGPYTSGDLAKDKKLVDEVAAPDKVAQLVATEMGIILPVDVPPRARPDRWTWPKVAVIYIDGDITDGASRSIPFLGRSLAGSQTLVAALSAARADPSIGAIILRIDSPGGSALASELIAREVFATRGVKPILCSMSDLAASGGYFVAAGCDTIYAQPMTITGSIGIFYGKFDLGGLAKKLGIATDTYKRGKRADAESLYRPYTDEERAALLEQLRYMYGRFVGAVAEGRSMKKDEVDAVGRGHVWTGAQALPVKLVDKFGGIGDALDEAKRRMKLAPNARVQLVELPNTPTSLLGTLTSLLGVSAAEPISLTDLPMVKSFLAGIPASVLVQPDAAQARLPNDIVWE